MKVRDKKNRKNRRRSVQRGVKYWVLAVGTMGTLVAYSVGNSRAVALAHARGLILTVPYAQEQERSAERRFDIPPGSIGAVLDAFQKLTGWVVIVPNEGMRGILSPGVSGVYRVEQALNQLLTGTGISYRVTAEKTATLEIQASPESVEVRDRESTTLSSPKFTEPLLDTPQTITFIPKEVIEEQGATTLRDVLRNVPGITVTAREGGNPAGDNLTVRGFSARNDVFVDGVRDLGPQSRDPFNLEQVEVVK
ncbi:MAG: TonB-dependent receptor plug domain-containing protein [Pyrinomonadaceae bacterium]